jgi:hypothetical protein
MEVKKNETEKEDYFFTYGGPPGFFDHAVNGLAIKDL